MRHQPSPSALGAARRGMAMVLVFGVLILLTGIILLAADRTTATAKQVTRLNDGTDAAGAVEAVLVRRERDVSRLATIGDAANFATWSTGNADDGLGLTNYGVDVINGFEVRWKIEPARTAPANGTGSGDTIDFIANPSPDPYFTPGRTNWLSNDTLYLYRVAAEARTAATAAVPEGTRLAQGVRYVSINREPLFRYVLFYAQKGPKGDLELSHADPVNIQGSIHSNGAIYVGGGLKVNDKLAQRGTFNGALNPTTTFIGKDIDDKEVRANGLDGIFRLSKPLLFNLVNGFPLGNTPVASAGTPTGFWTPESTYDTTAEVFPTETTVPPGGNVMAMTEGGTRINPYRVKDGSGAITQGPADGTTSRRTINGTLVTGVGGTANDSRDKPRADDRKWVTTAADDFDNYARSSLNGGTFKAVAGNMARGLEAQALTYTNADNDSTTDDHEYARPLFLNPAGEALSDPFTPGLTDLVENPGYYLSLALGGSSVAMKRYPTGDGWQVVPKTSQSANAPEAVQSGLIIRERPVPQTDYWPGTGSLATVDQANPRYLPYAYGKHWYPTVAPFTPVDVSDNLLRQWRFDNGTPQVTANISLTPINRLASYAGGGRMTITAATNPGSSHGSNGTWAGTANGYLGSAYNSIQRKLFYFRDAWRFVHLGKYTPDSTRNGLLLKYYQDRPTASNTENTYQDENYGLQSSLPYSCGRAVDHVIAITAPADGVVAVTSGAPAFASTPTIPSAQFWSARWVGFYRPSVSGLTQFTGSSTTSGNHRVRLWVDGQRVWEANMGATATTPNAINLSAGQFYPLVLEFASSAVGAPGGAPTLQANLLGSAASPIPSANLFPPKATAVPPLVPLANFTSLQCRIDNPQAVAPATAKVGLMLRPEQAISPLGQGGAAYAMVGWSPVRGFFTQRRVTTASQSQRSMGVYYIGNGTNPVPNAAGEILVNPRSDATVVRSARWTQVATGIVNTGTAYQTNIAYGPAAYSTQPTPYTGPMTKDVGGGKIWQILTPFSVGPYVGNRTATPQKRRNVTKSQNQTIGLTGALAPLLDADRNRSFDFYTGTTGTATVATGEQFGFQSDNRPWWFSTAAGLPDNTNRTNVTRTWSNTWNSAYINGVAVTQGPLTFGNATTAWSAATIQISKVGAISNATTADLTDFLGSNITALSVGNPNWPGINAGLLTFPADAATPAPTTPATQPVPPTLRNFGTGLTFSVQRLGSSIWIDQTPWLSTNTPAPTATTPVFLPRATTWPATWTGNVPTTWPMSWGQRPDVWNQATAMTIASVPAAGTSSLRNATAYNATGVVTGGNGFELTDDVRPSGFNASTTTEVWLRIEKSGTTVTFKGFAASTPPTGPTDPRWITIGQSLPVADWSADLQLGPCVQSGDMAVSTQAGFSNLKITTSLVTPADVIDANDWDSASGTSDDLGKYLISQYQVFFGTREITEDFFLYKTADGRRLATEDWIYQPREFWSQGRRWSHTTSSGAALEKDPFTSPSTTFSSTTNRRLLGKTTLLSLDLGLIQDYLTTRTLGEAVADRVSSVGAAPLGVTDASRSLASLFNGVIYAARTNRYPWNPSAAPHLASLVPPPSGANPWSPSTSLLMPNSVATPLAGTMPGVVNGAPDDSADRRLSAWSLFHGGVHKLEPYGLAQAPAWKPQQFHHGIRVTNAANINIKYPAGTMGAANTAGGRDWSYGAAPALGTSRLSVVTPNQLYVQGSLNTHRHLVTTKKDPAPVLKYTPLAIMGDQITFLSNAWNDANAQLDDLTVTNAYPGVSGSGTLATSFGPPAIATNYHAGIVTNNLPTTRARVMEGQSAPFIDSMLFLENWNNVAMKYLGSLVVLDSRRYSQSFLLGSFKTYGTTPLGIVAANDGATPANTDWLPYFGVGSADWIGRSPAVFSEPLRTYEFNYDFLTSDGTPPYVPFGVSGGGIGGWVQVFK